VNIFADIDRVDGFGTSVLRLDTFGPAIGLRRDLGDGGLDLGDFVVEAESSRERADCERVGALIDVEIRLDGSR
jgi:hypothetical protein